MSSKRYEYKVLESSDLGEFEQQLTSVGGEGWSAVGYGVLPNGNRSALLQRKQHDEHQHHDHHRHGHDAGTRRQ
jgi:hypothetical protein